MLCHIAGRCHPSHSLRVKCIIEFVLKATLPAEIDMEYYVFHLATLSSAFLAPPPPLSATAHSTSTTRRSQVMKADQFDCVLIFCIFEIDFP